jgi:antitoxin CptB
MTLPTNQPTGFAKPAGQSPMEIMDREARLKRLRFRASHRGTKEADMLIGGFFYRHASGWGEIEMDWFETLLEEQDVDIMAWAIGTAVPPDRYQGPMMRRLQELNFIEHPA